MGECDELTLLTKRVPYVIQAQVSDVKGNMACIEQMKIQAAQLRLELDRLLQESEIRLQVASVNSLPPCEVLQAYANMLLYYFLLVYLQLSWSRVPKEFFIFSLTFSIHHDCVAFSLALDQFL